MNAGPSPLHELAALHNRLRVFRDRRHAGAVLADLLAGFRGGPALVLAIPAGGVPVAAELAQRLALRLDVLVVSKLTLPWNTEAGYGALAFDGTEQLNEDLVLRAGLGAEQVDAGRAQTRQKIARRVAQWRGTRPFPELSARPVIVVDDGVASGFTLRVAIEVLRNRRAGQIIVAVPTAHAESLGSLLPQVDAIYCANVREGIRYAVADAYEVWTDVTDEAVTQLLGRTGCSAPD